MDKNYNDQMMFLSSSQQDVINDLRYDIGRKLNSGVVQHYVIVGPKGSGKTTLLFRLTKELERNQEVVIIFVAGYTIGNSFSFFKSLLILILLKIKFISSFKFSDLPI